MVEAAPLPVLDIPEEPTEFKAELRDALLGGQAWADLPDGLDLGAWLWTGWQPTLETLGLERDRFDQIVASSRREQRLWVLGDRQWRQFADGLAGRVLRRLPSIPAPDTA